MIFKNTPTINSFKSFPKTHDPCHTVGHENWERHWINGISSSQRKQEQENLLHCFLLFLTCRKWPKSVNLHKQLNSPCATHTVTFCGGKENGDHRKFETYWTCVAVSLYYSEADHNFTSIDTPILEIQDPFKLIMKIASIHVWMILSSWFNLSICYWSTL